MSNETITQAVSERYARAAATGEQICCPTGYNFEASRRVGPTGRVIGIDMTDEMLAIARRNAPAVAANLGYAASNVEFRKGMAEAMPVEDGSIDLIISNCVINLAPEKRKVFHEMFRVLRPGGRFTISDIVSEHPVPNYLIHDAEKWGNCLSGALQLGDYVSGMVEAGFLGIHQIRSIPWQEIDGIHFLSITLTGYKLPAAVEPNVVRFATLRGPFSQVVDELGQRYQRGVPQAVNARTVQLLKTPPFEPLFLLSETPLSLEPSDARWLAVLPEQVPCVWKGHFAILAGPFLEAADDDHHVFRRGNPLEICSKTLAVLGTGGYDRHFVIFNRAGEAV